MGIYPMPVYSIGTKRPEMLYGTRIMTGEEVAGLLLPEDQGQYSDHVTYIVEPKKFLPWMLNQIVELGCKVALGKRISDLHKFCFEDEGQFYDVTINCLGLSNHQVARDKTVYPIKGQIRRAVLPWVTAITLTDTAYTIPKYINLYKLSQNVVKFKFKYIILVRTQWSLEEQKIRMTGHMLLSIKFQIEFTQEIPNISHHWNSQNIRRSNGQD